MVSPQPAQFKSAITVTSPAEGTAEVLIGRSRAWDRLAAVVGQSALFALIAAAVAAYLVNAASFLLMMRTLASVIFAICLPTVFVTCFLLLLALRLQQHFRRTLVRITASHLGIEERSIFGEGRKLDWPRRAIFEIRRSGSSLHVRLVRGTPVVLLRGRSSWEVDEALAAINGAWDAIPQAAMVGSMPPDALTYEVPGLQHEITIENSPDGTTIVIPGAGDHFNETLAPWANGATAIFVITAIFFIGPAMRPILRRFGFIGAFGVAAVVVIPIMLLTAAMTRRRRGQAMTIIVSRYVLIDHPGLLLRRRTWRPEDIADVCVDNDKNQSKRLLQYFVRMKTRGGQSIAFCHYRDSVERHRVVVALREALNLPPLADAQIAEDR